MSHVSRARRTLTCLHTPAGSALGVHLQLGGATGRACLLMWSSNLTQPSTHSADNRTLASCPVYRYLRSVGAAYQRFAANRSAADAGGAERRVSVAELAAGGSGDRQAPGEGLVAAMAAVPSLYFQEHFSLSRRARSRKPPVPRDRPVTASRSDCCVRGFRPVYLLVILIMNRCRRLGSRVLGTQHRTFGTR